MGREKGGRTGVVLHCGHEITYACPVVDGALSQKAACVSKFGGSHLTEYLWNHWLPGVDTWEDAEGIKKKHCFVRARPNARARVTQEMEAWMEEVYRTSRGTRVKVSGAA